MTNQEGERKIISMEKNTEGKSEIKTIDKTSLDIALKNLQAQVIAGQNAIAEFEVKKSQLNGKYYSPEFNENARRLDKSLLKAQEGDVSSLAYELRLTTITQINKQNQEKAYEKTIAKQQEQTASLVRPTNTSPEPPKTASLSGSLMNTRNKETLNKNKIDAAINAAMK